MSGVPLHAVRGRPTRTGALTFRAFPADALTRAIPNPLPRTVAVTTDADFPLVESTDAELRLPLRGTVGVQLAPALRSRALELAEDHRDVTVACGEVEHLDATALQLLIALRRAVEARGGRFALADVPDAVRHYLTLAGLSGLAPAPHDASRTPHPEVAR